MKTIIVRVSYQDLDLRIKKSIFKLIIENKELELKVDC
jgi:hypothetical protein